MEETKNKSEVKNLLPIIIVAAAVIVGGILVFADKGAKEPILIQDDPVVGNPDAKVVMVEFSDFQCPFCATYDLNTFPQIKSEYVDTGKVKVVFKNFPLPNHTFAKDAAEAGDCAQEQGKFWEFRSKMFENQQALSVSDLKQYAINIGLDATKFDACLDLNKFSKSVESDLKDGQKAGVGGTPTFFINGQELVGAQPFSKFQEIIEAKLKQ